MEYLIAGLIVFVVPPLILAVYIVIEERKSKREAMEMDWDQP